MHAKVVGVHDAGEGHTFEGLKEEVVEGLLFVFAQDFISEGEMLRHCSTFVITSKHYYFFRVVQLIVLERKGYFQRVKEDKDFNGEDASIDVVPQEEELGSVCDKGKNI